MHELSLASAVIDTATRHADGRHVSAVHLRVGHLRQVVPERRLGHRLEAVAGIKVPYRAVLGGRIRNRIVA